jgi:hypothetical protein
MNTSCLHPGDHIKANVRGQHFEAEVVAKEKRGLVKVEPIEPWPTWRFLTARQIVGKVERQERLEVRA